MKRFEIAAVTFAAMAVVAAVYTALAADAPTGPAPAKAAPAVAAPSQAAPFKWPDEFDPREVEAIPQAEQERMALEFMRAFHPMQARHMEEVKRREPAEYFEIIRGTLEERLHSQRMRLENPNEFKERLEMLQLNARCEQLALLYRDAEADKRPAIEKQLKALLDQVFEARQKEMERHLEALEREYRRLKTTVEKRAKYKDKVIDIHILRMLGEDDILEMW